jgi:8-oxo-dGTP diphosphatase
MNNARPNLAQAKMTVDVVVFTLENDVLKALLIRRAGEPFAGQLALPGGFLWEGETTLQAAARLLHDKAGVNEVFMEQLYTFDEPQRDPRGRVVSVTYYALVPRDRLQIEESPNTEAPALYDVSQVKNLAFDHGQILDYAVGRLRAKLGYTNAAYSLLPERFTFSQLQRLYEVILDRELDKRNFRKKYLSLGFIEATNERVSGGRHRPAELYRFTTTEPTELSEPAL